jgi:hypothetical protein
MSLIDVSFDSDNDLTEIDRLCEYASLSDLTFSWFIKNVPMLSSAWCWPLTEMSFGSDGQTQQKNSFGDCRSLRRIETFFISSNSLDFLSSGCVSLNQMLIPLLHCLCERGPFGQQNNFCPDDNSWKGTKFGNANRFVELKFLDVLKQPHILVLLNEGDWQNWFVNMIVKSDKMHVFVISYYLYHSVSTTILSLLYRSSGKQFVDWRMENLDKCA